jgi:hypothetical protein
MHIRIIRKMSRILVLIAYLQQRKKLEATDYAFVYSLFYT